MTGDLRSVEELCRLAVDARRLGCHIHLPAPDRDLDELLELAGVDDVVRSCPAAVPDPDQRGRGGIYDA